MERYICIHGHFYQPPRESPWLETIEPQESAAPYHDWNERITAECYAPNAASPILDKDKRVVQTVNNYAKISFNFGPTLLSWVEEHRPEVYQAILEADRQSRTRFSGHGSAIAQIYNHMIMPLADRRDKTTQALWGIRDFERRFGRFPEGMWLPETAVDHETLEVLAELGIKFTILGPHQVRGVRGIGDGEWQDTSGGRIDPTRAYLCTLPSGRSINVFVYDGAISHDVSFGDLLHDGELFGKRLMGAMSAKRQWPQIVNIATDGETYGHHRRFADMALAYGCHFIESNGSVALTNYGEYLERHRPTHEVSIVENSSWSCAHGIERWRDDCGCHLGTDPVWNQAWRRPLRNAMDWLRERVDSIYEAAARIHLRDPWEARNDYIGVMLDRSAAAVDRFLERHQRKEIGRDEKARVLKLLEMQKNRLLMFTSCGWFFDEISGIEAVQVMRYAARAIELAGELQGSSLEPDYVKILERAPSNRYANGARVYDALVRPAKTDSSGIEAC